MLCLFLIEMLLSGTMPLVKKSIKMLPNLKSKEYRVRLSAFNSIFFISYLKFTSKNTKNIFSDL